MDGSAGDGMDTLRRAKGDEAELHCVDDGANEVAKASCTDPTQTDLCEILELGDLELRGVAPVREGREVEEAELPLDIGDGRRDDCLA